MKLVRSGEAPRHQPPLPNTPIVEVLFGGDDESPDVGLVRVSVPPGAGMPRHDHGGSDVILMPLAGFVEIVDDNETIRFSVGDAALVRKDELVALSNPGDQPAELIVAAGPSLFVAGLRSWRSPADNG